MKLTGAQASWLLRASRHPNGLAVFTAAGSGAKRTKANWKRMMLRLADAGYVTSNAYDEFEITDKGRAALDAALDGQS